MRRLLRQIPTVTILISGAAVALINLLHLDILLPVQLSVLRTVSITVAIFALLFLWVRPQAIDRYLAKIVITGVAALVLIGGAHTSGLVLKYEGYGDPPSTHRFITGFELTEAGQSALSHPRLEGLSREQKIRRIGTDQIPHLYGRTYYIVSFLYFVLIVLLVWCFVLAVGGAEARRMRQ